MKYHISLSDMSTICEYHGNCYSHELNRWLAGILGISTTDEDGVIRSIGYSSHPNINAVLWCVTLRFSACEYAHGVNYQLYVQEYECTEIMRQSYHGEMQIDYVIHPVHVEELSMWILFPPPRIDIARNGKSVAFTHTANDGQILVADGITVEFDSWLPFDRYVIDKN